MTNPQFDGRTVLETERLRLRAFRPEDIPLYAAMNADPEVMRYLGGVWTPEHSEYVLRANQSAFDSEGHGRLAIERKEDGAFLGTSGVGREVWYPDDLEIAWRLIPAYWGKGYASEAARAWVTYMFDTLGRKRVISIADVPNKASIAVMQRLGMVWDHDAELDDEGELFEAVIYTMTAEQWRAGQK